MAWHLTNDPAEFSTVVGDFLRADPLRNTQLLSITATLIRRGPYTYGALPPRFGWYRVPPGDVEAVFLQTPPRYALVSPLTARTAESLVDLLAREAGSLPGVSGDINSTTAFAEAWRARTGQSWRRRESQRLYVLGTLTPPHPMPAGAARLARPDDRELLLRWYAAFCVETDEPAYNLAAIVDERTSEGTLMLWEVDGEPVSMAGIALSSLDAGARVGPVYTPPESRRRGYAGAITAAISRRALDDGAPQVSLFTDLANPISNGVYQRLGYVPVEDRQILEFEL
jgi:predicted GNAT family acetyltransferase